jgi:hypothetical protein
VVRPIVLVLRGDIVTMLSEFLLLLTVGLLIVAAGVVGWLIHEAQSFKRDILKLRRDVETEMVMCREHIAAQAEVMSRMDKIQSDVAGLKIGAAAR